MFKGLFSTEAEYARDFADVAHRTTEAARLLVELLGDPVKRAAELHTIAGLARGIDATSHLIQVRVAKTFLAPIDREDVGLLASRLEAVFGAVERTARLAEALHIDRADAPAARLAETLVRGAEALETAVASLKDPSRVTSAAREVKRLEEEGDAVYGAAMTALFAGRPDPLHAFRWKELYGSLEQALDDCAHAAATVEAISLKRL